MRHITKSAEPASLTAFKKKAHSVWSDIHQADSKTVYEDCLAQCQKDQCGVCGYTEISLSEGIRHIDHYIKRDVDASLTFCWANMVAAVKDSRYGADWKDENIKLAGGYDKVNQRYKDAINPVQDCLKGRFRYSTDGTMEASNPDDNLASNTITLFNLNASSLKDRRRQQMEAARLMRLGGMSDAEILANLSPSGFVSAVEYELAMLG